MPVSNYRLFSKEARIIKFDEFAAYKMVIFYTTLSKVRKYSAHFGIYL